MIKTQGDRGAAIFGLVVTEKAGSLVTLNLAIGQQTPPVASVLITACSIAKANIWEVSKVNVYFVGVLLMVLLLSTYVPAVPMFLVELFYR